MLLFGAAFTLLVSYAAGSAIFPRTPLPAVLRFGLGAAILSVFQFFFFVFGWGSFPYPLGFILIAWAIYQRPLLLQEPVSKPLDTASRFVIFPLFAAYAIFYLVNALAPEIQPDAAAYHLALPAEYLRLGRFPARVGFYEMLPQGLEMLFAVAISHGAGYSSAKLVHFAFLLATVPLLVLIARRLQFSDLAGYAAALLYFIAPVVGISGSSAYNDAGLVFFTLAAFYLLLQEGKSYALAAGVAAGFCFAVKFTGLLVPLLGFIYLIYRRRPFLPFCAGAASMIAPWMLRNAILTGNPLAPLFNSWFPNPYFSASAERVLAQALVTYNGFHWAGAPWDWAFSGALQGVVGPLIFLIPVALLAWRRPSARIVLLAGILLLVPVFFNVGTRFLMQALPLLALAAMVSLPRPAILACVLLQGALCFPAVLNAWGQPHSWFLQGFPWRAALRLESETHYLETRPGGQYALAHMVETSTGPQDKIFALTAVAGAYTTREILDFWHSTQARQLTDALQTAMSRPSIDRLRAQWPARLLQAVRVVASSGLPAPLRIYDISFYNSAALIDPNPNWFVKASPNLWDAPRAIDGNRATYWSSLSPQRAGMFLEADFDKPQQVDSAQILIERSNAIPALSIEGRAEGQARENAPWLPLADGFSSRAIQQEDLRHEASRAIKGAGFTHILTSTGTSGLGPIGKAMLGHPQEWGVELTVRLGDVCLFRLL